MNEILETKTPVKNAYDLPIFASLPLPSSIKLLFLGSDLPELIPRESLACVGYMNYRPCHFFSRMTETAEEFLDGVRNCRIFSLFFDSFTTRNTTVTFIIENAFHSLRRLYLSLSLRVSTRFFPIQNESILFFPKLTPYLT